MRIFGTPTKPETTEPGTTKPGMTEPGTTFPECDIARKAYKPGMIEPR
jgi:hypothetical protein